MLERDYAHLILDVIKQAAAMYANPNSEQKKRRLPVSTDTTSASNAKRVKIEQHEDGNPMAADEAGISQSKVEIDNKEPNSLPVIASPEASPIKPEQVKGSMPLLRWRVIFICSFRRFQLRTGQRPAKAPSQRHFLKNFKPTGTRSSILIAMLSDTFARRMSTPSSIALR